VVWREANRLVMVLIWILLYRHLVPFYLVRSRGVARPVCSSLPNYLAFFCDRGEESWFNLCFFPAFKTRVVSGTSPVNSSFSPLEANGDPSCNVKLRITYGWLRSPPWFPEQPSNSLPSSSLLVARRARTPPSLFFP